MKSGQKVDYFTPYKDRIKILFDNQRRFPCQIHPLKYRPVNLRSKEKYDGQHTKTEYGVEKS
nr:MAG TPA: hypothetical protein [Caudoviricetes sp.]